MASAAAKYPCPSEVKVTDFVPIKLSPSNYVIWKQLMLSFIKGQNLVGFIDGTIPPPPKTLTIPVSDGSSTTNGTMEIENQDYQHWKRSDSLVKRWILSTLNEDDFMPAAMSLESTAQSVWTALERTYSFVFTVPTADELNKGGGKDLGQYLPLHRAALTGDWESAEAFIEREPEAAKAIVTGSSETALHVAVRSAKRNAFTRKLVERMSRADLAIRSDFGATPLHVAAAVGNLKAAMLLVNKNCDLPNITEMNNVAPLHVAASYGHRNLVSYLLTVTKKDVEPKQFEGEAGNKLMYGLLASGFYDIALSLLKQHPKLAWEEPSALLSMQANRSAFLSGTRFNFWERFIYRRVPVKLDNMANHGDGGNTKNGSGCFISVPQIKSIQEKKALHHQVLELVQFICLEAVKLDNQKATQLIRQPMQMSVCLGIHEIFEEILATFPGSIRLKNVKNQSVFQEAIVYRRANTFNLIYQLEVGSQLFLDSPDISLNMGLHLAACLTPQQQLKLRASATNPALQMQRELQWFREVEKLTLPQDKEQMNAEGMTPAMIFTETHKDLVKDGEKWMKGMAQSCSFVATLIVSVAFASAITVPGGNKDESSQNKGQPIHSNEMAFVIFGITDALALFSSTSSLLMFLSILTSRYAEEDFRYALPKKLIIGLATLFLSILSVMIAFSAAIYLVFGDRKRWTLIAVSTAASLPVASFASLQFHLLLNMIKSTYFPRIFYKQSDRVIF